ncbi:hypothetical protein CXF85_00410 [Colwellia sp. 75C3]|uniref:hypothetical protein n=1 Tax=Colwellia sp. 75C3 TaxID=888425 RepID=UPI000C323ED5|nr:hypothetical protein [Colwellia sp. 75C3]PKG86215.1 hypothetical protein CXF85_00410 [Colwellia sp. 75C3]
MNDIEKNIAAELKSEPELAFSTSDDDLFKRATATGNNRQGSKDLLALGMASLWVVFISIFMKILKPIFKQMAAKAPKISTNTATNTTNNRSK